MAQSRHYPSIIRATWLSSTALILVAGLALVYLGVMRVIVGFILLPGESTLDTIQLLKPVPDIALNRLIDAQSNALAFGGDARIWANEGLALALKARMLQQADAGIEKVAALRENARDALLKSLDSSPANPYVWTRLALLSDETGAPAETVLVYWRYAQLTGPNEPRLRLPRISLGTPLWNLMNETDRAALAHDIVNAWPADHIGIVGIASNDFARAIIRSSLLSDLQKLIQFEKEFAQSQKAAK